MPQPERQQTSSVDDEQAAIRAFLQEEEARATYDVKDLLRAAPEYDPASHLWDREAKIAEIKARPTRKERFTNRLSYARPERNMHAIHDEVDRPLPKAAKRKAPLLTNGHKNGIHSRNSRRDVDMQTIASDGDSSGLKKPKLYGSLEEMLGLPNNMIPTLYEGRLMFRDGTLVNGELKRAKERWAVGRNVPGELK